MTEKEMNYIIILTCVIPYVNEKMQQVINERGHGTQNLSARKE